ncbi:MAG TPA: GYF domain-containing protein [Thermoanaerobaculia bacterium]|jgi:uncharacterized protein (DUF697 family)|nr:GYF domain-containing protein [Thermoanaerobaculia bacterium]
MDEGHLLRSAAELARELDKVVDDHLPQKLAGVVKLHAKVAVGAAFIPIPGADIAAAVANTWTMYVRINKEIDLPFGENIAKSLATGVITNIASNAAALIVLASAAKLLPVLGTLGGAAVMATTIYALTIAAGIVYMKALATILRTKHIQTITEADLKRATDDILKDKASIRDIVSEARETYKTSKNSDVKDTAATSVDVGQPDQSLGGSGEHVFVAVSGETHGPYSVSQVRMWLKSGRLKHDCHYWTQGMTDWRPILFL